MKKKGTMLIGIIFPFIVNSQMDTSLQNNFDLRFTTNLMTEGTKAFLFYQTSGQKFIDSAEVQHNLIRFSGGIPKMLPATVVVDHQNLGLQKLMKQGAGDLDFLKIYLCFGVSEANTDGLIANAIFKRPGINYDFAELKLKEKLIHDQWSIVSRQLAKETDTGVVRILRYRNDSLNKARVPVLKQFIVDHPNSFIALVAWEEYKGYLQQQNGIPSKETTISETRALFERLSPDIKNSEEARDARRFITNITDLQKGSLAPEFSQPDMKGRIVKLSDFRGKYLLLDFWASWCGPCRANNPRLIELYEEFKNRNFTILGISLDEKDGREKWLKAIKIDGLKWLQVSDLKHWDNDVVKLYGIPAIPYSLLVDPEGKIITQDGSIDDIRKLLNKMLPAK